MAKPIIRKIAPIDATLSGHTYSMSYTGSVYRIETTVYDAETLAVVATGNDVGIFSAIDIPIPMSSSIVNGKRYALQATIYGRSIGDVSAPSDLMFFWAFKTPTFKFLDLDNREDGDNKIDRSSFNAIVEYTQDEGEPLTSYVFYWYDKGKVLLNQTDASYDVSNIACTYRGLSSNEIYYIRCSGVTKNGIVVDTGLVKIFPLYDRTSTFSQITATTKPKANNCDNNISNGIVYYNTNMVDIEATRDDYDYVNGYIDLTQDYVEYNEYLDGATVPQFTISGDFTIGVRFKEGWSDILKFSDGEYEGTVTAVDDNGYIRYRLLVKGALSNYILYSGRYSVHNNTIVTLFIVRKGQFYNIDVYLQ